MKKIEEAQKNWGEFLEWAAAQESWQWALNEMSEEVIEKFNQAIHKFMELK